MTPSEIRTLRTALGLSQTAFLAKLGITATSEGAARQRVFRWETGKRNPGDAALILLERLARRVEKRQ